MGCFHGLKYAAEFPRFHHHFQPYLIGMLALANLTGVRRSTRQRSKCSLTLNRPPALVVIPNLSRTGIEHRLLHRLCMILGYIHHDLHQDAGFRAEDALAFQRAAHETGQSLVHAVRHIVQVGVNRVQLNALANGRHDRAFYVRRTGEPLQAFEHDGMMGNNQVGSTCHGLGHDFLRAIQ